MSTEKAQTGDPCKVITGKVRFSYVHVFEPKRNDDGTEKYQLCLLIDEGDTETLDKVRAAIEAAKAKGKHKKFEGKIPNNLKLPLSNGNDKEDAPEFEGCFYLNCNADPSKKPGVVDAKRLPITDPDQVYSGCYGRASITFFPYNFQGKKGIGCGLNNLQKLEDGERLGNFRPTAEDDFSDGSEPDDFM